MDRMCRPPSQIVATAIVPPSFRPPRQGYWVVAPEGRKEISQGQAQRRPWYSGALEGRRESILAPLQGVEFRPAAFPWRRCACHRLFSPAPPGRLLHASVQTTKGDCPETRNEESKEAPMYRVAIIGTGRMGGLIEDEIPEGSFYRPYGHFSAYA